MARGIGMSWAENHVAKIIEHSPNAIVTVDRAGRINVVNIQACELFGYRREELLGRPVECLLPVSLAEHHVSLRDRYVAHATPRAMGAGRDLQGRHKSGSLIDVEVALAPLHDDNGETVGVIATIIDIRQRLASERQLALQVLNLQQEQQALQAAERNLANIIEHSPNAMITVNAAGLIDMVNAQAARLFGYLPEELRGQAVECLLPGPLHQHHVSLRDHYMQHPTPRAMGAGRDLKGRHRDGSLIDVEVALAPLLDANGTVTSVIATIIDIRQRLQTERILARQIDDLTRINEELDRFAYVASHDLKSPLNAIQKIVGWIEEDCAELLPRSSQDHLALLKQRANRLMRLLDDLLAYSRAGRREYEVEHIELAHLTTEIFALLGAPEGFSCVGEVAHLQLPRVPFETVLNNLISNAIKHHDQGHGNIRVRCQSSDEYYQLEVEDDGPGIPPELHHKALAMFQTLQPRDRVEGSGMGLALVKKIVEHHHGSLRIDSDGGRGTTMVVQWPRPAVPAGGDGQP
ncbi:PAS domain-containing sensor histidine kinase [Pokkaliibacter plantistimulans]|uniref:histidine kinase n=2 Tax=Pseudomonadota TaxID=1224 RepID=A0A2S5KT66_9PROT|nr:PAS domain-containing sensor histidine kinase [Pokkaliibacter plantistimulans]